MGEDGLLSGMLMYSQPGLLNDWAPNDVSLPLQRPGDQLSFSSISLPRGAMFLGDKVQKGGK